MKLLWKWECFCKLNSFVWCSSEKKAKLWFYCLRATLQCLVCCKNRNSNIKIRTKPRIITPGEHTELRLEMVPNVQHEDFKVVVLSRQGAHYFLITHTWRVCVCGGKSSLPENNPQLFLGITKTAFVAVVFVASGRKVQKTETQIDKIRIIRWQKCSSQFINAPPGIF